MGAVVPRPDVPGLTAAEVETATAAPRRYGFHATLKPPFVLAEGRTRDDLEQAAADFCRTRAAVALPVLRLASLDGFLALVPSAPYDAARELAADCLRGFDAFRAPPSREETARRRAAGLSPRQADFLETWGYPYVLEEFRLHLTLTERLPEARRRRFEPVLSQLFEPALAAPPAIDGLALYHEVRPGAPFVLVRRFRFGPPAA